MGYPVISLEVKPLALLGSRFREVLLLDAVARKALKFWQKMNLSDPIGDLMIVLNDVPIIMSQYVSISFSHFRFK